MGRYHTWKWMVVAAVWCLFWAVGPCGAAEQPLSVSPAAVDLGTFRLPAGQSMGPMEFTISVTGGPVPAENEEVHFTASSNQSWLSVDPASGTVPGSITGSVTIPETLGEGEYQGTITITGYALPSDNSTEVLTGGEHQVTVTFQLIRSIGDLLTVSPSFLDLEFTTDDLSPKSYSLSVRNADPDRTTFDWSTESRVPWLSVVPGSGQGNATAVLTVDPSLLPIPDDGSTVEGTVVFRSNLNSDPVELTVQVRILPASLDRLSVFPSYLYWSVERTDTGTLETLASQTLFVLSQNEGWQVWTDVPFLSLENLEDPGTLIADGMGTRIAVTPSESVLQGYGYGRYEAQIYVSNLSGDAQRVVPVTIDIRRPGEPVEPPIPPDTLLQSEPGYVLVEATDAGWFEMLLTAPETVARYSDASSCQAAGGTWMDPDGLPGSLDETCSLDEKVYVLATVPDALPGRVYALSALSPGGIVEVSVNGVRVADADQYYYATGPIPRIPIGPVQLLGLYGRVFVSVRVGKNLDSAREVQRVQMNVRTPEGSWLVTESYGGSRYHYGPDRPLVLAHRSGGVDYEGSWDGVSVSARPGDGIHQLYILEFEEGGFRYRYEITELTGDQMSGRWMFSYDGGASEWEAFEASRLTFVP